VTASRSCCVPVDVGVDRRAAELPYVVVTCRLGNFSLKAYLARSSEARFSHGLCQPCFEQGG
jgi:hypothetical protein